MSTKPSSSSTSRSVRSGIENQEFARSARDFLFGNWFFSSPGSLAIVRKETSLEVRAIRDCEIQRRSAEVLEHLSHREKRLAAGSPMEALSAYRYQGTRSLRNRSANSEAARQ